ncbi:MAG: hypothetical protein C4K49_01865 [Candidatus Thorarchaeota archaeon]|nr:MAG: hypothetical protein C4K49_01865 [Candidatus Thorarchaeota archaeon]
MRTRYVVRRAVRQFCGSPLLTDKLARTYGEQGIIITGGKPAQRALISQEVVTMRVPRKLLDGMRKIVGPENVSDDPSRLREYEQATLFDTVFPSAVVMPGSTEEVQQIVELANRESVPLIPVSSGKPRLRGESAPKVSGVIAVDLRRMNRILRVDRKNKVTMIEPGVTYSQLIDELKEHGLRILMPLLPKSLKSAVANCLDREPITMPRFHWDSSDPLLCTEVVFGSGDLFRTGAAAGPGNLDQQWASGQAQKNPMGPSQFDPFRIIQGSQGTMGIVTWATVKCEVAPDVQSVLVSGYDTLTGFQDFMYSIFRRKLVDDLFILNSTNLACALETNKPKIEAVRDILPKWSLILSVSGHGILAEDELEYRLADTLDVARESGLVLARETKGVTSAGLASLLEAPSKEPYWKLRLRGGCQEVFFITTLDKTPGLVEVFEETATEEGFPLSDVGVYIQPTLHGANVHCEFDIYYDAKRKAKADVARSLYSKGCEQLMDKGAYFSRPCGPVAEAVYRRTTPETITAMRKVKAIFDPNAVLNPGALYSEEVKE